MKWARSNHLVLALGLLGAIGCDDSSPNVCRPEPEGRIAGVVRTGGVPFEAVVRATRITDAEGEAPVFEAAIAPNGSYTIAVPAGRYVVGLRGEHRSNVTYEYSADGLRFGDAPPDTLRVDSQEVVDAVDFELAGLRAHVELPLDLEANHGIISLYRRNLQSTERGQWFLRATTGQIQGGAFDVVFSGVLPGSYKLEAEAGYPNEVRFWYPGVRDSAASPWVEVRPNTAPNFTLRLAGEPAQIQGSIRGAWLDFGHEPPSLSLFTPDSVFVQYLGSVASDGSFDRRIYFPGPAKLLVSQGIGQWIGGRGFADATVFPLEPGRTISGIEFMQCGMFVEVMPFDPRVESAQFNLYDAATSALVGSWWSYFTDRRFGISNLRPGAYRMMIATTNPGFVTWAPQWYDRAADRAHSQTITIAEPGDIARVPLVLEKGGTIAGVVREMPGVMASSSVYITTSTDPTHWGWAFLDRDLRSFTIVGLPDGDWKVGARLRAGNEPEPPTPSIAWYPGTTDWQAAGVITIRGFEDITGIEITLPGDP